MQPNPLSVSCVRERSAGVYWNGENIDRCIHPKSEKIGGDYLSAQKNWQKMCVNLETRFCDKRAFINKTQCKLRGDFKYYFGDLSVKGGGVPPQIRKPLFAKKKSVNKRKWRNILKIGGVLSLGSPALWMYGSMFL